MSKELFMKQTEEWIQKRANARRGKGSSLKGKTYWEIYGIAGALRHKEQRIGKKNPRFLPGVSDKILAGFARPDVKERLRARRFGKTFEDLFGTKAKLVREKISKGLKAYLAVHPRKMSDSTLSKIHKSASNRPNRFEKAALAYLAALGRTFVYTGDGSLLINGRSPDALEVGKKCVALFNGVYWHLRKKGLSITEENKRLVEVQEKKPFNMVGYDVVFIWEDGIPGYKVKK